MQSVSFSIANDLRQRVFSLPIYVFRLYIRVLISTSLRLGGNVAGTVINLLRFADNSIVVMQNMLYLSSIQ